MSATTLSLVAVSVLGFGAFRVTQADPPTDAPAPKKDAPPKSLPLPVAENTRPLRDRFGDPLPEGAIRRFGTLRFRHEDALHLAFTPDGKQLIAGAGNTPLAVFDAATGRKVRQVGASSSNNYSEFALSPDGKRLACCGDDVFVWELETGRLIRALGCGWRRSVAFSPDGKLVAAATEFRAEVVVAEVATAEHRGEWTVKKGWVDRSNVGQYDFGALAFSPDGKFLAGFLSEFVEKRPSSYNRISSQVWLLDAVKGARVRTFGSADVPILAFAFQPGSGRLAGVGKDGILRFWDVTTGKEVQRFPVAKKVHPNLAALRFSADGRRCVVYSQAGFLIVLDARNGRELRRFDIGQTITSGIAVALSSDGGVVASAKLDESCVRVWDVESGVERLADAGQRAAAILSLSADGRTLVSRGSDDRVIHWDLRSGNGEVRPADKREEVGRVVWLNGGREDWTLRGPRWRLRYQERTSTLEVWSLDGSKLLGVTKRPGSLGDVILSPDGSHLAFSLQDQKGGNAALLWNPEREKEPRRLRGQFVLCRNCLFTHDGKRLIARVGLNDPNHVGTIWVWDVATAKVVRKLPPFIRPGSMILTADDRRLITSDAGRTWDLETGNELPPLLKPEGGAIEYLFLSADERFLVGVVNGSRLMVWETASWQPIRSFAPPPSSYSMILSRDGRSLFVANRDSTILEWDVSGRQGRKTEAPGRDRLNALWRMLAETPDKAYPAVWELLDHPAESVPFLKAKLVPIELLQPIEEKRVRRLLGRLDSESFAEREEASRQLLALGERVVPVLRQALKDGPSLETRKRVENVVETLTRGPSPEPRQLRALAVLEWSGLADEHLRRLADGEPSASLTREAKAALKRRR